MAENRLYKTVWFNIIVAAESLLLINDDRVFHKFNEAVLVVLRVHRGDQLGVMRSRSLRFEEILARLFNIVNLQVVYD